MDILQARQQGAAVIQKMDFPFRHIFPRKKASFEQLGLSSDCHCHLLPGVDDGAGSLGEACEVLSEMLRMGIRSVVLTPHLNPEVYPGNDESMIRERYREFLSGLPEDISSGMDMSLGAEYMVTDGFEDRDPSELIEFQRGKILMEMSYMYPSANMEKAVFNIVMSGRVPVIAHPERYLYYAGRMERFEKLHDMGAEFQMNVISLSGAYGAGSMSILKFLLKKGWYSYVATDTHNPETLTRIRQMRFDSSLLEGCAGICQAGKHSSE